MVVVLVLVMIRLPLSALKEGIGDLLLGAPPGEMQSTIRKMISADLSDFPMERHSVRMVKVGRHISVSVNVLLPGEGTAPSIEDVDILRKRIDATLKELHPDIVADILFTGDGDRVPESPQEGRNDG